jgi:S-disulfanyl-L-cysteine oxidoreductase SoxD
MSKFLEITSAAALALLVFGQPTSAQDAAAGEKVFSKCKACHAIGEGAKNKVGPQLNDLIGRTAGTVEGYKYSPAMSKVGEEGLVWNDETLKTYLTSPKAMVKGTKMTFAGLKKDEDLVNIIAYLHGFSSGSAAPAGTEAPAEAAPDAASKAAVPASEGTTATHPQLPGDGAVLGLGRLATEDEIAAWDIDVRPDGTGLPKGRGTVAQGEPIYEQNCASCHGDFGEAVGRWPVLAGGADTLTNDRPEKTVGSYWPYLSTVFDYVRRAMPFGNARSLSDDDVYALTAYILYLNDVVTDETFELSSDNFTSIKLPNEDNFIADDRAEEAHNAVEDPCMTDCVSGKAEIKMHAAVLDVTPEDSTNDEAPAAGIE